MAQRSFVWSLVASAGLLACSHGSARLGGHWRGVRAEGVTAAEDDSANGYAGKMQLDVSGDTIAVTSPAGKDSGKYKVVSEDKTTTVISAEKDGTSDPQVFTFVDDKTMRWQVAPGKAIVFDKE